MIFIGRIIRYHRIEIAGGNAAEQSGRREQLEIMGRIETGLGKDGNTVTMAFEQTADERDAEGWMIDVIVTGDQQDIEVIPAPLPALLPADRQGCFRAAVMGSTIFYFLGHYIKRAKVMMTTANILGIVTGSSGRINQEIASSASAK